MSERAVLKTHTYLEMITFSLCGHSPQLAQSCGTSPNPRLQEQPFFLPTRSLPLSLASFLPSLDFIFFFQKYRKYEHFCPLMASLGETPTTPFLLPIPKPLLTAGKVIPARLAPPESLPWSGPSTPQVPHVPPGPLCSAAPTPGNRATCAGTALLPPGAFLPAFTLPTSSSARRQ